MNLDDKSIVTRLRLCALRAENRGATEVARMLEADAAHVDRLIKAVRSVVADGDDRTLRMAIAELRTTFYAIENS